MFNKIFGVVVVIVTTLVLEFGIIELNAMSSEPITSAGDIAFEYCIPFTVLELNDGCIQYTVQEINADGYTEAWTYSF